MKFIDISGQRFGRLVVVGRAGAVPGSTTWHCVCGCGVKTIVRGCLLKAGHTKSCGCIKTENMTTLNVSRITHGQSNSPEWNSWQAMIVRCTRKSTNYYANYGGRGITVCPKWRHSFETFLKDMGPRPRGTTLDRYPHNAGNYEPDNCRWATPKEQANNTRTNKYLEFQGERLTIAQWCDRLAISRSTVVRRLKKTWAIDRVLTPSTATFHV